MSLTTITGICISEPVYRLGNKWCINHNKTGICIKKPPEHDARSTRLCKSMHAWQPGATWSTLSPHPPYLSHSRLPALYRPYPSPLHWFPMWPALPLFLYSWLFSAGVSVCCHLLTLVPHFGIFLPWIWRRYVPPKRRFTQDLHSATCHKTAFFTVSIVSNFLSNILFQRYEDGYTDTLLTCLQAQFTQGASLWLYTNVEERQSSCQMRLNHST
jgi:hypothetical protein